MIKQVFLMAALMIALAGMKVKATSSLLKTEIEPELELESWMVDDFFWTKKSIDLTQATDEALELEAWMTDDNYWR